MTKIISIIDTIYILNDIQNKDKNNPNFYIPANSCKVVWNKSFIIDNFICIKRDDFYNQIPYNHKVVLLGGYLTVKYDSDNITEI